jgi:hypothetical protein
MAGVGDGFGPSSAVDAHGQDMQKVFNTQPLREGLRDGEGPGIAASVYLRLQALCIVWGCNGSGAPARYEVTRDVSFLAFSTGQFVVWPSAQSESYGQCIQRGVGVMRD